MPYAIVPFYGTLPFVATHSIQFYFLGVHICFFLSFFFCSTHCTFWFTLYNTSDVCVDLKFSLWYVCTYDNLHTNTHLPGPGDKFIQVSLFDSLCMRLVSLLHDITNLDPDYTRYVVSGALWFDVRFTFCHSKLLVFSSLFLLPMESVF